MSFTDITIHIHGEVVVLDPSVRMCLCEDDLRPLMTNLLERGFLKFLLNLHRVHYIDSAGTGGIVQAYTMVARQGGKLKLCNLVPRIRDLFDVNKLTPVFEVFDTEEAGLRSFEESVSTQV
jgi:anti-anti-sigma factor